MPRHNAATGGFSPPQGAVLEPPAATTVGRVTPCAPSPVTQPTPKASAPAQNASGGSPLRKVSFGKIATKKDETKTAYPVAPDADGKLSQIAARILERIEQFEALKGALETDKAELKMFVAPYYFTVNHGRQEIPSSVSVNSPQGEVLVTFANRYSMLPDESGLLPVLGNDTEKYFRESFELKIKGDKLPSDKTQELLDRLQNLFAEYGATDALEVKAGVKPVDTFHADRHRLLTPEQNMALEQVVPIIAMVKTKGRK